MTSTDGPTPARHEAAPFLSSEILEFSDGKFTTLMSDPLASLDAPLNPHDEFMNAAGYASADNPLPYCGGFLIVWEGICPTEFTRKWRYMVEVSPIGEDIHLVCCPSLGDFLQFTAIAAPYMAQQQAIDYFERSLETSKAKRGTK